MDNREKFKALMKEHGIKQSQCAVLLEAVTQRPCSARAIRSWINDPEKESSRPCPDWAVSALERAIEYMKLAVAKRAARTDLGRSQVLSCCRLIDLSPKDF